MLPVPEAVKLLRRYLFTVVPLATVTLSAVFTVVATVVNVARSAKVLLSAECCTLKTESLFIVFAVTWI
jgi:hypothetical protein